MKVREVLDEIHRVASDPYIAQLAVKGIDALNDSREITEKVTTPTPVNGGAGLNMKVTNHKARVVLDD